MADWGKILSRGSVEDRRGFGPGAIGGIGIGGIAIVLLFSALTGSDPIDIFNQINTVTPEQQNVNQGEFEGPDSYEVFASTVLGSNNDMWTKKFGEMGKTYTEPKLVLFRTGTQSACGFATSQVGPHYCSADNTIYLDETFFDELTNRFGAQGGDVAEAYVIAHEVGHHVQNQLGTMQTVQNSGSNDMSIKLELQADCFGGLWANSIKDRGVFEVGEIREAMDAAAAVGDDRIQESVTGQVNPESWTHGSSDQRVEWFNRGYNAGNFSDCDTFDDV